MEFKLGDTVERIIEDWANLTVGSIGVIHSTKDDRIYFEHDVHGYDPQFFKLVESNAPDTTYIKSLITLLELNH